MTVYGRFTKEYIQYDSFLQVLKEANQHILLKDTVKGKGMITSKS